MVKPRELDSRLEWIEKKLATQINRFFKSQGYTSDEIKSDDLYRIEIEDDTEGGNFTDVYVYAEISIEEFSHICESWDDLVSLVDPAAYFDPVQPGIYMARIYWESLRDPELEKAEQILTSENLLKFAELACSKLSERYDENEDFWVDDASVDLEDESLNIEVSSDNLQSEADIYIKPENITCYDDLVDLYLDDILDELDFNLVEI